MFKKKAAAHTKQLKTLQRLSLFFFNRPRTTALIWLVIAVFGASCYVTLLKREGFPSINTPYAIAKGSYLVHDPAKVDSKISKPFNDYVLKQDGVKMVQSQSFGDFYLTYVQYSENVDAKTKTNEIAKGIKDNHILPENATFDFSPYEFGFTERGDDLVISFYSKDNSTSTDNLVAKAKEAADYINSKKLPLVSSAAVVDPYELAQNPLTGTQESVQKKFDRYGEKKGNGANFYSSSVIGIKAKPAADNLELYDQVKSAIDEINRKGGFEKYNATISASFAPQIREQINELQTSLLEGLAAVLAVGSLVIAIRASLITVLSMVTVIAAVNGLLYLIGYSLNTITLFSLILGLALIVDDTIIMVEALDVQRRRQKDAGQAVSVATGKVSRAMIAATSTAALSFAPLLFVSGILGSFVRAIPVTIISALIISLFVALVFIPFFARFLLLGKKQMGESNVHEVAAGIEAFVARFISGPMIWAKGNTKRLFLVGVTAVVIGFGFVGTGGYLMQKVKFNIFPSDKDTNQIQTTITFKPNTGIEQAQQIAQKVDGIVGNTVDGNFVKASYYGQGSIDTAILHIDLSDYKQREITAPQIVQQLNGKFENFPEARVEASTAGVGPPPATFVAQIASGQNREAALKLASDIKNYVTDKGGFKRPDGRTAKIKSVSVGNSSIFTRKDGKAFVTVEVRFVDDDTSALFTLAEKDIKGAFPQSKVATYDLPKDALKFDTGQEEENQNSFKTLALAFPVLLLAIYLLLAAQFRSLLQPLLIFMAIPFSLFGITLGLYLTDNAFSFFAMLGFFALIGLSIKNTILLTDYANQARKSGMGVVDSIHEALAERFRPLIATSFTAVFSLLPLTIASPFWQGLGVVLICGLLSSTFLVLTVFPYYYLGAEYLRQRVNRRTGLLWLGLTIALSVPFKKVIFLAPLLAFLIIWLPKRQARRRKTS